MRPKSGFRSDRYFFNSFQALVRASTQLNRLIRISWINHCPFCIALEFLSRCPLQTLIFCIRISAAPWIVEKSCAQLLIANVVWSEVETTFVQTLLLRFDLTSTLEVNKFVKLLAFKHPISKSGNGPALPRPWKGQVSYQTFFLSFFFLPWSPVFPIGAYLDVGDTFPSLVCFLISSVAWKLRCSVNSPLNGICQLVSNRLFFFSFFFFFFFSFSTVSKVFIILGLLDEWYLLIIYSHIQQGR